MGLRERKKAQTRRRIVAVALERFAANGYDATTVEGIAQGAEVSVTTFFRYFAAKDDLLFLDDDLWENGFRTALRNQPAELPDLRAIHQAVREFYLAEGFGDDQRRLCRHRIITQTPMLRGRARDVAARAEREIADVLALRRGVEADDPEVRLTAAIAMTVLEYVDSQWAETDGKAEWLSLLDRSFNYTKDLTKETIENGQ